MRILIIDDDQQIINFLKTGFEAENYYVDFAEDGEQGSYLARSNEYDVIILDYNLPKLDGKGVCRDVRMSGKNTPIIILSVKTETDNKVDLLNQGADDYLNKPFSFEELMARIKAILRRPRSMHNKVFKVGDLVLDISSCKVKRGAQEIYLTRKEFGLLEYLMKNEGRAVSRAMLLEHVWDMNADPFSNTIESHVLNLRKKIDSKHKRKLIHTIPGRGYKMEHLKD